ncbi:MBL fold metallo-hydrolase [Arthrobacter echini]|uniref:MBL fold metallo-hydrolase n=2 Tax=Arthrobacter echini TaxID=1529066 RepID=A0A4S5E674_9MICC|nr:MBL fold metallo-hydrolase [Arthrobacter echini]
MALGDRTGMDPALAEAMRTTGLTHLTAVSGANCSYVVGFAYLGLRTIRVPRLVAALGAVVALVCFVMLVGPEPSVLRAAVMGSIGVAAVLSGRGKVSLTVLLVSVIALLAADPWLCVSFAFILSVLATLGLITAGPMVVRVLERIMPRFIAQLLAIPLTAQMFCTPVLVLLQPTLPLYSLPANVLASPVVPGITLLGMLAVLALVAAPALAHPLITAAHWGTRWVAGVSDVLSTAPAASLPWPTGAAGTVAAVLGAVLLLLLLARYETAARRGSPAGSTEEEDPRLRPPSASSLRLRGGRRPTGRAGPPRRVGPGARPFARSLVRPVAIAVAVCIAGGLVLVGRSAPPEARWILTMCDVGQGDGIVVRTTEGHALVVDVGPDPEAIDHCLDTLGIQVIDALVISHLHEDHYGGIEGAVRDRTVSALYYSTGESSLPGVLADAAGSAGVAVTRLTDTTELDLPPLAVDVLWAGGHTAGTEENDSSAVLEILVPTSERPISVLLLGDLEEQAAATLLAEQPDLAGSTVDVLKIAHHGARNGGTALIEALRPRLALISVGSDNGYGHPHAATLEALDSVGTATARTDQLGSFTLDVVDSLLEIHRIR